MKWENMGRGSAFRENTIDRKAETTMFVGPVLELFTAKGYYQA